MQKLVIVGGGASGIFCAVNAARLCPGLQVIVLEKTSKLLAKVKISGGGRCNVTHHQFNVPALIENYPRGKHFLKKSFYRFSPADTIGWFAGRGVKLRTEQDGRMFPESNNAQSIIDCLLQEAGKYKVEIRMNTTVAQIEPKENKFILHINNEKLITNYLVIACGGFAKLEQFSWMQGLQHTIQAPVPSLFTFNVADKDLTQMMGVSVPKAEVKINGTKLTQNGPVLITHWGFSGPAILKLSAWGARLLAENNYRFTISINWTNMYNEHTLRTDWTRLRAKLSAQKAGNKNPFELPARLWLFLLQKAGINPTVLWSHMSAKPQNKLIQLLTADEYVIVGKTTFKEEFVTAGGVSLNEVDAATMESRLYKHLFFTGEIMDVDGITGGFNFQHAWASGMLAAQTICQYYNTGTLVEKK